MLKFNFSLRTLILIVLLVAGGLAGLITMQRFLTQRKIANLEKSLKAGGENFNEAHLQSLFDIGTPKAFAAIQRFSADAPNRCWIGDEKILFIDRSQSFLQLDSGVASNPASPCLVGFTLFSSSLPAASSFGLSHESKVPLVEKTFFHAGLQILKFAKSKSGFIIKFDMDDSWRGHVDIAPSQGPYEIHLANNEATKLFPPNRTGVMRAGEIKFNPEAAIQQMEFWFDKAGITVKPKSEE